MERFVRVLLLGIMMMFGLVNTASAESVRYPLNSYVITSATCDFMGECDMTGLHMAEDVVASAGTAVYAPASGTIKDNTVHTLYGTVVLLEANVDGDTVVFLMGHMRQVDIQVSIGRSVNKGQLLGYIGTNKGDRNSLYDNGGWPDHLHFGVHKGSYSNGTSCTGAWTYAGYETLECAYDDWYDPTDFITSHQIDCTDYSSEISAVKTSYGSFIGTATNDPHLYYQNGEYSDNVCIRDYDASGSSDG
ncbi:MAG: peptidoglycan DD-metalloendopeptidase family protein, partial [Candidatus Kerfeldbacteria bacterium]|nr:peptidoglycan DD-metalloendopeptidase family protein [Candidatus Kerfeldbacteria bacterium]